MNKCKIYCAAALAAVFSMTALAGGPDKVGTIPDYSGFYSSVGLGMANGDFKLIGRTNVTPSSSIIFLLNTFGKLSPEAFSVRLDLGYGRQIDQFYVGGYVGGQYQNLFRNVQMIVDFPPVAPIPLRSNRQFFSAALRYTYGFGLKTGMLIAPRTLLFFKLGLAWANFKFKTISDSFNGLVTPIPLVPFALVNSYHQNLIGGEFGIGLERRVSRHWSVAVKYLYSMFGSITRRVAQFGGAADRNNATKYRLALSSAFASINYYFNPSDYDAGGSDESAVNSDYFNTIYVGLYGGLIYQDSSADLDITTIQPIQQPTAPISIFCSGLDHSKWSGLGGVEIGIGHIINRFYLGAVAHGDLNYMRSTVYYNSFSLPILFRGFVDVFKAKQYWGVAAKLGVLLAPKTLFYSKVGAVWGRFIVETVKFEVGTGGVFNGSSIQNKVGTQVGLGIEQYLGKHFTVHVEDDYSFYPTIRFLQQQILGGTTIIVRHKDKVDINVISAGFDYYFSL